MLAGCWCYQYCFDSTAGEVEVADDEDYYWHSNCQAHEAFHLPTNQYNHSSFQTTLLLLLLLDHEKRVDGVAPTMMMMMKDCLLPFPTPTDYSSYSDDVDVDWAVDQHGAIAMKPLPRHYHHYHYPLTVGVVIFDGYDGAVPLSYASIFPFL